MTPHSIDAVAKVGLNHGASDAVKALTTERSTQVTPEQREKFSELMQHSDTAQRPEKSEGINAVTNVLQSQQDSIDQASTHMMDLVRNVGHMSPMEQFSALAAAQNQIAATTVRMQLAQGVVKGSKQSLQHLLKNE